MLLSFLMAYISLHNDISSLKTRDGIANDSYIYDDGEGNLSIVERKTGLGLVKVSPVMAVQNTNPTKPNENAGKENKAT